MNANLNNSGLAISGDRLPRPMQTPATAGFSMVELMVTVAIAALLAAIATPAFSSLFASQRAITFASELYAAVAKTRSEALTFNRSVTLSANLGGWSNGWQILDPNKPVNVLEKHGAAAGISVTSPYANVTYNSSGRLPVGLAPTPMFVITTNGGGTTPQQCVSIDLSGRPYMQAASTC